jgi:hypothetical protein
MISIQRYNVLALIESANGLLRNAILPLRPGTDTKEGRTMRREYATLRPWKPLGNQFSPFNPGRRLQFLNNLQDSSQGKMVMC